MNPPPLAGGAASVSPSAAAAAPGKALGTEGSKLGTLAGGWGGGAPPSLSLPLGSPEKGSKRDEWMFHASL